MAAAKKNADAVESPTLSYIWGNRPHIPVELASRYVLACLTKVPGVPQLWEPGGWPTATITLVGESGCGKTEITTKLVKDNGFAFSKIKCEGTTEDYSPIPTQFKDEDGRMIKLAFEDLHFPPKNTTRGMGLLLMDESTSSDTDVQKILRGIISGDGIIGVPQDLHWFPACTANPVNNEYLDTKPQTKSLSDRSFYIPVRSSNQEVLRYYSGHNKLANVHLPEVGRPVAVTPLGPSGAGGFHEGLYTFLVMHAGGDGTYDFMRFASARRWSAISWMMTRFESSGIITPAEILTFLGTVLNEEVVVAYRKFLQNGSDPDAYAILGHKWLAADPAEHRAHMERMRKWENTSDKRFLVKLTASEIKGALEARSDDNRLLTDDELVNARDLLAVVDDTMTCTILRDITGELHNQLWNCLPREKAQQMQKLSAELNEMHREAAAARAARKAS